jgi:hypothetical protein
MSRRAQRFRYRDEESSASVFFLVAGAVAGAAAGVLLAQRYGGLSGLSARVREGLSERFSERFPDGLSARLGRARGGQSDTYEEEDYDTAYEGGYQPAADEDDDSLEGRVLTAFRNDPILSERGVDIGMLSDGIIELTGSVHDEDEVAHALTLTQGVPGVTTVVNRVTVRGREELYRSSSERYAAGDPRYAEAHWEGQQQGTGRRRQGASNELDRHATPKAELEDRWLSEQNAIKTAADDTEGLAERRAASKKAAPKGDRTGGSPIAPTGVPKGDHVAEPQSDETAAVLRESTGRDTRAD